MRGCTESKTNDPGVIADAIQCYNEFVDDWNADNKACAPMGTLGGNSDYGIEITQPSSFDLYERKHPPYFDPIYRIEHNKSFDHFTHPELNCLYKNKLSVDQIRSVWVYEEIPDYPCLLGQTFGNLKVIEAHVPQVLEALDLWKCECYCENTTTAKGSDLISGKKRSCGCS